MTVPHFATLLAQWQSAFEALNISAEVQTRLAVYLDHLWKRNMDLNLVSRKMTPEVLITDHLLDSLIALPHLPEVALIADLGTGGGLPAIPLAMCRPNTRFLLFEKSPLKCKFLRELFSMCDNLQMAGTLGPKEVFPEVDLVIARGFKSVGHILSVTPSHHERGGAYLLYKARRARIDEELAGLSNLAARIIPLTPYGEAQERNLVCIP